MVNHKNPGSEQRACQKLPHVNVSLLMMVGAVATNLLPAGRGADIDDPLLKTPDPDGEGPIEEGVENNGGSSVVLGAVESKLVVPEEAGGGDQEGAVAQAQTDVGEGVRLLELERVQVVGDSIVGRVLKVWDGTVSTNQLRQSRLLKSTTPAEMSPLPARL